MRTGNPIWVDQIDVLDGSCTAHQWSLESEAWSLVELSTSNVNDCLCNIDVRCELALPIRGAEGLIGVAWIKYLSDRNAPSSAEMLQHVAFASTVGLVLSILQRVDKEREVFEMKAGSMCADLFGNNSLDSTHFDVHVISKPRESRLGGDFFSFYEVDRSSERLAIVIGDGEGHGYEGTLHMLPLFTACNVWKTQRTTSTQFILQSVMDAGDEMKARGTVMMLLVDIGDGKSLPVISGTSAGHPSAIILSETGVNKDFPTTRVTSRPMIGLGLDMRAPLGEAWETLNRGDVIVAFTDGVHDAGNNNGTSLFGRIGILKAAINAGRTAKSIAESVVKAAEEHGVTDDITVLVVRIKHPEGHLG